MKHILISWFSPDSNVFNNGFDAFLALMIQIGCSIYSCLLAFNMKQVGFNVYAMPLLTISLSAIYDSFGRLSHLRNQSLSDERLFNVSGKVDYSNCNSCNGNSFNAVFYR